MVTGGEDNLVNLHEGPPFKFAGASREHTRFVNCVRFSPNGERHLSVGSDSKGIFYDGKTGAKTGELSSEGAHTGSIFAASWSPDGARVLTASGDKTCKLWDAATGQLVTTFTFADKPGVEHMQVGCLWAGSHLVSLGLSGDLFYLDLNNPDKPLRTLLGHQTAVHALAIDRSAEPAQIFSGASNGIIRCHEAGVGPKGNFTGAGHTNQVTGLALSNGNLVSTARDDSVRFTPLSTREYSADKAGLSTPPVGVATSEKVPDLAVVVRNGALNVVRSGKTVSELAVKFVPLSVALSPDGTEVAVGAEDFHVHLFNLERDVLVSKGSPLSKHRQHVTTVAYSPDGTMLASACAGREIFVWDRSGAIKIEGWVFHSSRIASIAWSPDSARLASGSLDAAIYIWSVANPTKRVYIKGAHPNGVNAVGWIDNVTVVSAGQDCLIRTWEVPA